MFEQVTLAQPNMTEHLPEFIEALDVLNPQLVAAILDDADPVTTYEANWNARLQGNEGEREAVSLLLARAQQASGPIRDVARTLSSPGRPRANADRSQSPR